MTDKRSPVVLLIGLLLLCLSCSLVKKVFSKKGTPVSTVAPTLAPPPKAATASGSPEEQAAHFAALVAVPATRLSGWLGLYDAVGIPVVGQDGKPLGTTGDDPIGPRYWQVWYASSLDVKGRGLPLNDAGRFIGIDTPGLDAKVLGAALLEDLRVALKSSDPKLRLLGAFVRERIKKWPSHLDIEVATTTADKAVIDLASLELILWATARSALSSGAATTGAIERPAVRDTVPAMFDRGSGAPGGSGSQTPCSEKLGDGDTTYWTNWLANKAIGGGVQLPGMKDAFKGLIEKAQIAKGVADNVKEKTSKVIAKLNLAGAVISLLMQLAAMEIEPKQIPAPLIRTKTTSRGKDGKLELQLYSSPEKLLDGNQTSACLGSMLMNAFGISFSFPAAGPISGAEMFVQGGEGFPNLVLFNTEGTNSMKRTTDSSGVAEYKIFGAPQAKDIPDTAKETKKEFSVHVEAQPEEMSGKSMLNIFFGGLTFGAGPSGAGGLGSAIDIAKAFKYDMGEYFFDLTDWTQKGYRASGSDGPVVYSGVVCALDKPFTVTGTHPMFVLPLQFTPSSASAGSMAYGSSGSGITSAGGGPYTVERADTDTPRIVIQSKSTASNKLHTTQGGGQAVIMLTRLESDECK